MRGRCIHRNEPSPGHENGGRQGDIGLAFDQHEDVVKHYVIAAGSGQTDRVPDAVDLVLSRVSKRHNLARGLPVRDRRRHYAADVISRRAAGHKGKPPIDAQAAGCLDDGHAGQFASRRC